jgi:hypothetical protein
VVSRRERLYRARGPDLTSQAHLSLRLTGLDHLGRLSDQGLGAGADAVAAQKAPPEEKLSGFDSNGQGNDRDPQSGRENEGGEDDRGDEKHASRMSHGAGAERLEAGGEWLKRAPISAETSTVTGMTITAAIVAALCAVTILVLSGGSDRPEPAPCQSNAAATVSGACETDANGPTSACQTASGVDCVQAAKDIAASSGNPLPADPAESGVP